MKDVGSNMLKASDELIQALQAVGRSEHFPAGQTLFAVDDKNDGVFLIRKGKIRMSVQDAPKLDRTFSAGSLLGLPATFTTMPYSLTAVAISAAEVVHVPQKAFLDLMQERSTLCREATDMLCLETTFIQSALADRRRCTVAAG